MVGERASKARQRERGQICWGCSTRISSRPQGRERLCHRCALNQPRHRVLMNFMLTGAGWRISFLEADCKTILNRKLVFSIPDKIFEMARRGGADLTSAGRCDLENGISIGRGGVWLNLSADQYHKLKMSA